MNPTAFEVETLFGDRQKTVYHVYARELIEKVSTKYDVANLIEVAKPLLLAIALKDDSPATFNAIIKEIEPLLVAPWTSS